VFGHTKQTVLRFAAVPAGVKNNKKRGKYLWPGRCSAGHESTGAEAWEEGGREKKERDFL
jgi:hypothetical protein